MEISAKELRIQSGRILEFAAEGNEVTVTYRGKPLVKIVPLEKPEQSGTSGKDEGAFGLWKNKAGLDNVQAYLRKIREGRVF